MSQVTAENLPHFMRTMKIATTSLLLLLPVVDAQSSRRVSIYTIRPDFRDCASPVCGGYFLGSLDGRRIRCDRGSWETECYVAALETPTLTPYDRYKLDMAIASSSSPSGIVSDPDTSVLVKGTFEDGEYEGFPDIRDFVMSYSWLPLMPECDCSEEEVCVHTDPECTDCLSCPSTCRPIEIPLCGGFAGVPCPNSDLACVDDPSDDCDPLNGGADCIGICTSTDISCLGNLIQCRVQVGQSCGSVTRCGSGLTCVYDSSCCGDPSCSGVCLPTRDE